MADESDKPHTEESFSLEVPIRYYGTDEVTGIFADNAMVQHWSGTFTITFYQHQVPPTEDIAVLKELTEMPTKCVARIVLTPKLMEQLYKAMEKNMAKFKKLQELEQQESNNK